MSLINDALKRAKEAQQQAPLPQPDLPFRPIEPPNADAGPITANLKAIPRNLMKSLNALVLAGVMGALSAGRAEAGEAAAGSPEQPLADKRLEEKILGYWAPNWEAIAEKWKPMFKGLAELSLGDRSEAGLAEAEKEVAEEVKELCRVMTMEVVKDKYIQHTGPGRVEEQGYVVKKVDAKTGTIEVELPSSHGGTPERGRIILTGDRLTIIGLPEEESASWILDRIDKQTFEKRQAAAAKSKLFEDKSNMPGESKTPKGQEPKQSEGQ